MDRWERKADQLCTSSYPSSLQSASTEALGWVALGKVALGSDDCTHLLYWVCHSVGRLHLQNSPKEPFSLFLIPKALLIENVQRQEREPLADPSLVRHLLPYSWKAPPQPLSGAIPPPGPQVSEQQAARKTL